METVTVTFSPSFDRYITIPQWVSGTLHRVAQGPVHAAGKGINVARFLKNWGHKTLCMGIMGKFGASEFLSELRKNDIDATFVVGKGRVRTNLKIIEQEKDGICTEINEQVLPPEIEEYEEFQKKLQSNVAQTKYCIFSGSMASNVPDDFLKTCICIIRDYVPKATIIGDMSGEHLRTLIDEGVDWIKPNKHELCEYFELTENCTVDELYWAIVGSIPQNMHVLVSLGSEGALLVHDRRAALCTAPQVEVRNTVGAGDSMVAALAHALETGMTPMDCLRTAVATATFRVSRNEMETGSWSEIVTYGQSLHLTELH